jgi:hypothetical protein
MKNSYIQYTVLIDHTEIRTDLYNEEVIQDRL